jgi:2-polyprenyl-3-methyl-5-hydroxy-6-metoxy-1,4-benzoquinol methylase
MKTNQNPINYQIRVKGHLDERWIRWFEGLDVTRLPNGETAISGEIMDQAALHGILNRIRDLGMELISVQPKTISGHEPPPLEIKLTLALGLTVLSPYYRSFASSLNLRGNERVLDFGSGSGVCSRHIAARLRKGGHLVCVDISRGWMEVIQKTLRRYDNVSYHLGHISEVNLLDVSFDMIVIHFVLHDIPETERLQVMQILACKLKPGGRLLLREPQGRGLRLDELEGLAEQAGLQSSTLSARKLLIGHVYDGCFIHK